MSPPPLHIHPTLPILLDHSNRQVLLRGVNLSGDAKVPVNPPLAGTPEFYNTENVSYTGRPFKDLKEAEEWMLRFRAWGFNVIRLVVVWEALEPRKMGVYDDEYIAYISSIVALASSLGLYTFLDGHQDTFSRFTGGSGAPLWTFNLVGLDPIKFPETTACALDEPGKSTIHSTPSSRLWPTNYTKMAVATMFTLFFGGEKFAPSAKYVGDVEEFQGWNVGAVLRTAYIRAFQRLALAIVDAHGGEAGGFMGVDPINEPHPGYIGLETLEKWNETTDLHLGWMPSPIEGMRLAGGEAVEVGYYTRSWPGPSYRSKRELRNREKRSAWLPGREDIWGKEGVYNGSSVDQRYFSCKGFDFNTLYTGFLTDFFKAITTSHSALANIFLFLEPLPNAPPPPIPPEIPRSSIIYSPHWYDIRVLFEKHLMPHISFDVLALARGSRNMIAHTYFSLKSNYTTNFRRFLSPPHHSELPCLIGETGLPVDMNKMCYYHGDTWRQELMLDAIISAMERCNMSWTLWNVTLSHSHSHVIARAGTKSSLSESEDNDAAAPFQAGDGWNSEDFSLVSLADHLVSAGVDREGRHKGLRMKMAVVRPGPVLVNGVLNRAEFDMRKRQFTCEYTIASEGNTDADLPTVIFVPRLQFAGLASVILRISIDGNPVMQAGVGEEEVSGVAIGTEEAAVRYAWTLMKERLDVVVEGAEGRKVTIEIKGEEKRRFGWMSWLGW